jgi:hypothetical protein
MTDLISGVLAVVWMIGCVGLIRRHLESEAA